MGCRVSTPTKALPIIPKHKSLKHKSSLAVIAPQSQPGSPRQDHFEEKRMDAENSTGSLDSHRSVGNPHSLKTDARSKSKSSSPSPMIKIVGIGIGSSRIFSESSLKRSNSLDNSPHTGKHRKKDFTFHTGELSNATMSGDSLIAKNMQLNRFLSINPKPSEFFVQKVLGEKKLSKLSTYAAPGSTTEDLKLPSLQHNIVKSLAESHEGGNSSHHETIPDTPGFKKHISSLGSHVGLEDTFHHQKKMSRDLKSKRELEGDKMMIPELLAIPEGIFVDQDSDENPPMEKKQSIFQHMEDSLMSERIMNNNNPSSTRKRRIDLEEKREEKEIVFQSQPQAQQKSQKQFFQPQPQQQQQHKELKEKEQEELHFSAVNSKMRTKSVGVKQLSIQVLEGKEKQEDEEQVEGSLKKVREKKIISQPRFTRNLLDLVSVQKSETSFKKRRSSRKNHPLSGILEDLNHMSAASSQLTSEERLKQIINDELREKGFQSERSLRRESNRFTPLKFGNLEFLTNGEQVSPICNPRREENETPSNATFVLKSFIGSADFLEERTLSQISKIDFDAGEIKETEVRETEMKDTDVKVTDTHHSPGGEQPRRGISRKLVFENYLLGSQGLPSREEFGRFKSLPRSNDIMERKFETHEEFVENLKKGQDTSF